MDDDSDRWLPLLCGLRDAMRGREGAFRHAIQVVHDRDLKYLFISYYLQRARFSRALREALAEWARHQEESSNRVRYAVANGAAEIKAKLGPLDDTKLLHEIVLGEDDILKQYKRVLDVPLPGDIRRIVAAQFDEIQASWSRLQEIERMSR